MVGEHIVKKHLCCNQFVKILRLLESISSKSKSRGKSIVHLEFFRVKNNTWFFLGLENCADSHNITYIPEITVITEKFVYHSNYVM